MGNATCIFTVEERIGGPFVEITITVITNSRQCLPVVVRTQSVLLFKELRHSPLSHA